MVGTEIKMGEESRHLLLWKRQQKRESEDRVKHCFGIKAMKDRTQRLEVALLEKLKNAEVRKRVASILLGKQ